jgi:hypothetical protein
MLLYKIQKNHNGPSEHAIYHFTGEFHYYDAPGACTGILSCTMNKRFFLSGFPPDYRETQIELIPCYIPENVLTPEIIEKVNKIADLTFNKLLDKMLPLTVK